MRRNIVTLTISLICLFVSLELFTRFFGLAPDVAVLEINKPYGIFMLSDDPRLKYIPKPNSGDINNYGIRDRFYPIKKPDNTFRIVVLGDSIGFGLCTDNEYIRLEDTFAKVLERDLSQAGFPGFKNVEVINLSVSGYDTIQEVEFFKQKGVMMQPDLVIVAYCLNDSFEKSAELDDFRKMNKGWIENYEKNIYLKSSLIRLVHYRFTVLKDRIMDRFKKDEDRDRTYVGFKELKGLSEQYKFKTLVAIFPSFEDWDDHAKKIREKVQLEAKDNGFYGLDLTPVFMNESNGNLRSLQGRCVREHPDENGHRVAADAVMKYILDHELIK